MQAAGILALLEKVLGEDLITPSLRRAAEGRGLL